MKEKIQIGIPCGQNSEYYVKFLISSIEKTVSGKYDIEFIFGINQAGVDRNFIKNIPTKFTKKFAQYENLQKSAPSSLSHGKLLDFIFAKMDSKYGMVIDSDTSFIYKGWDEKLISLLDEETIIIGTEYGADQNKFMKNPNCIMSLFLVDELKNTGLTWEPKFCYLDITEENYKIYGRSIGDRIFLDASSEVPVHLHAANKMGIAMPLISPRIDVTKVKFMIEGMRGEEYHLDGVPIITHLGRSLTRDFKRNVDAINWQNRVVQWLDKNI
tara:strand:- start:162 stop:971 length:810 start_codon:yes stop_codon:yes gene_type:complete